jgi:alpha-glucosidase (family GH31 glycosyl hydrolase)
LWLPEGDWYNYFSDRKFKGRRMLSLKNNLKEFPLFVKAGSFIPMVPPMQNTAQYSTDTLLIHYYPKGEPCETVFSVYVDDGADARAVENHRYELIHLKASEQEGVLTLNLESENPGFESRPAQRQIRLIIHGKTKYRLTANGLNSALVSIENNIFDFQWNNQPVSLSFHAAADWSLKRIFAKKP